MNSDDSEVYRVQPNGMRLINTETLQLQKFSEGSIPPYAILSHVWGDELDECRFQDFNDTKKHSDELKSKKGYAKILNFCRKAQEYGHAWVWADTVCIDKTNYEELNTAINSMFTWYEQSEVCFAYLEDVQSLATAFEMDRMLRENEEDPDAGSLSPLFRSIKMAVWFQRGWTLQEFIAPSKLAFFSREWTFLFFRDDAGRLFWELGNVSELVGFQREGLVVKRGCALAGYAAETIMRWASERQTRQEEDLAYCLLGLFGVQMPIQYGEGVEGFRRLQSLVINRTGDPTLLIWSQVPRWSIPNGLTPCHFLASHPSMFRNISCSNDIFRWQHMSLDRGVTQQTAPVRLKEDLIIFRPLIQTLDRRLALMDMGAYGVWMSRTKPRLHVFVPVISTGSSKWRRANLPILQGSNAEFIHCLSPTEVYLEDMSDSTKMDTSWCSKSSLKGCAKLAVDRWLLVTFPLGMGNFDVEAAFPEINPAAAPGSMPMARLKSFHGAILVLENTLFTPPKRIGFLFVVEDYPDPSKDCLSNFRNATCRVLSEPDVKDISESGLRRTLEHQVNCMSLAAQDSPSLQRDHWRRKDQQGDVYVGIRLLYLLRLGYPDEPDSSRVGEESDSDSSRARCEDDVVTAQLVLDCPKSDTQQLMSAIYNSMGSEYDWNLKEQD